ncbi:MAG: hypothetical protein MUE60_10585, partial [Candidatus Eisenbacteria bacterium]|nr:hypothetical protein [Candidatus Eisenbacteria bacterium]
QSVTCGQQPGGSWGLSARDVLQSAKERCRVSLPATRPVGRAVIPRRRAFLGHETAKVDLRSFAHSL